MSAPTRGGAGHRDVIDLRGVRAHGHHGVLEHEKREGHDFAVDAMLHLDTPARGRADVLSRTVNYAEVAASIVQEIEAPGEGRPGVDLIETLAERIADRVLAEQVLVRELEITVHKPTAPIPHPFTDVAVRIRRAAPPVDAVLALGTNLGDRSARLDRARALLEAAPGIEVTWSGPVVETAPVGGIPQGDFLNTVIGVRSDLGPWELLDLAHRLEADADRERTVRWGPRTLDVDVITWGNLIQDDPDLTLPHPRAAERAFVLAPWAVVRPDDVLETTDGRRTIAELLAAAPDRDGIRTATVPAGARPEHRRETS